ncbi:cytochrome P450 [Cynara cardunculus var. scolymus]|uniref:Cytochrome P450 n=1 Tax=Cynara cardunculus var. scolymus TaxID=59895 RepID=A0A103XWX5_CYNCS|nr:cytochrome P450 [Cynara cardunculus var. scolymus]
MCLLLLAALSLSISTICYRLYFKFIKVPSEIQRHFRQQGVGGPTYNAISGNSNELRRLMMMAEHKSPPDESFNNDHVVRQVMPHYYFWSKVYGDQFLFWFGTRPRLAVTDPEMIKEVLLNTNGWFRKARVNPLVKALFGEGIVYLEGEQWADMVPEIVASTNSLLAEIEVKIGGENRLEFDVYKEFNNLSADVISRTAFGSNFEEGKRIFEIQDQLIKIASEAMRSIIEKNDKTRENPKALLSLLMSPYKTKGNVEKRLGLNDIVDECKTIYFAGKESTANLLTWVFLLLASHQEWQNRAREEVVQVCGRDELPSAEHLANFKMVSLYSLQPKEQQEKSRNDNISMILNEALRLYPAAPISVREACKNVKLGSLQIPANTELFLAMAAVHHDPKIWGEDANKFNPLRFIEPKKHLASYFPFGIGPRICVGQNLAIVEAKIVVAMIIRKYRFVVSPSYVHSPFQSLTVGPQYGAPMIFSKV